jgi:hypothetical protein
MLRCLVHRRLEWGRVALRGLPGLARPARSTMVRALWRSDRLAGRPLPRVRRATPRFRIGTRGGRILRGCAAVHSRVEGARPPPRGGSSCRARCRAHSAACGRRHCVYPARRRPLPGSRPSPGRAPRNLPRTRVGPRLGAIARSGPADSAASRADPGRAAAERSRGLSCSTGCARECAARRRRLYDRCDVRGCRGRAPGGRCEPRRRRHVRARRPVGAGASTSLAAGRRPRTRDAAGLAAPPAFTQRALGSIRGSGKTPHVHRTPRRRPCDFR